MARPTDEPIGLLLARSAKAVSRAFDDALADAGGSRPMWLILLALKQRSWGTQAELARSVGIKGPTLTHHLDGMVDRGLVTRRRDPDNRRVQIVELTAAGDAMFHHLRKAAARHDRRLRQGFDEDEIRLLRSLLRRMGGAVTDDKAAAGEPAST